VESVGGGRRGTTTGRDGAGGEPWMWGSAVHIRGRRSAGEVPCSWLVAAAVPRARHDARFTRTFEDQVAWPAANTSKSAVAQLMLVTWRTCGRAPSAGGRLRRRTRALRAARGASAVVARAQGPGGAGAARTSGGVPAGAARRRHRSRTSGAGGHPVAARLKAWRTAGSCGPSSKRPPRPRAGWRPAPALVEARSRAPCPPPDQPIRR
jgi:hypothetical protein